MEASVKTNILRDRRIAAVFLTLLTLILVARSFFSFCQTDESFYAALTHRLWSGERMFWDEWNTAQTYIPLLLPFYGLFVSLRGTTEGVLLYLRLVYLCFSLLTAIKLYHLVLKKSGSVLCSAAAAATVLLFCRGNIQGLSYYNLCAMCGISAFCSFEGASEQKGKLRTAQMFWAGILLACSVLCNPFLAPFVVLGVLLALICRKKVRETLTACAGILAMACFYCVFLLLTTGLQGILKMLPYVLDNPEKSDYFSVLRSALTELIHLSKYPAVPSVIYTIYLLLPHRHDSSRSVLMGYLLVQIGLIAFSAVRALDGMCGAAFLSVTVAAFPFWVAELRKRQAPVAAALYLYGAIYAAAYILASNTGADSGTVGFCMSAAAGIWLAHARLQTAGTEMEPRFRAAIIALVFVTLTPVFCQRVVGVYRDAPLCELDTQLSSGPAKGLFTTKEHAAQYERIGNSLDEFVRDHPDGKILYSKLLPWAYLRTDGLSFACSSPWRTHTEVLQRYYSVRPENCADYICILKETVAGWEKSPLNRNPGVSKPNALDYSAPFWKQVLDSPILVDTELMTIYDVRQTLKKDYLGNEE